MSTAPRPALLPEPEALLAIRKAERERREKVCIVASLEDPASDEADECVIPIFNELAAVEIILKMHPRRINYQIYLWSRDNFTT